MFIFCARFRRFAPHEHARANTQTLLPESVSRSLLSSPCLSLRQVQPRSFCADCKSNSAKHRCTICQVFSNKSAKKKKRQPISISIVGGFDSFVKEAKRGGSSGGRRGVWKMDREPRDKEMDERRSSQRLARIQHHLRPGLPLCSPGQLEFMATLGIGQPALELATAFPQATPASIFPPAVSDYYQLDGLLSPEDVALRERVRDVMETHVAPVMTKYWEKAEFPFEVVPKLASLMVAGGTVKGYGCPGLSVLGNALMAAEIARVDASCSTFFLVHSSLCMATIAMLGSEEQKQKYLPSLARLDTIGCWALTEPAYGSDASSLNTTAVKVDGGWQLNGQKRWIGNSTFADVAIIFARNTRTNQINGFIVKKGAPGYKATKIENKIGLRMVQNGDIVMEDVFVPDEDRLPGINSFQDTNKVLAVSRIMVAWQPVGIAMGVYDVCHRYLRERKQFGAPLAALQISQEKLVRMLGNIQAMSLLGWRLCKLYEAGTMSPGQASLCKAWNSLRARETVALGRELLGGNGILADFLVAKAFCDLEPIYTYEGTYEVNVLVTGREITGIPSIKPAAAGKVKGHLISQV